MHGLFKRKEQDRKDERRSWREGEKKLGGESLPMFISDENISITTEFKYFDMEY